MTVYELELPTTQVWSIKCHTWKSTAPRNSTLRKSFLFVFQVSFVLLSTTLVLKEKKRKRNVFTLQPRTREKFHTGEPSVNLACEAFCNIPFTQLTLGAFLTFLCHPLHSLGPRVLVLSKGCLSTHLWPLNFLSLFLRTTRKVWEGKTSQHTFVLMFYQPEIRSASSLSEADLSVSLRWMEVGQFPFSPEDFRVVSFNFFLKWVWRLGHTHSRTKRPWFPNHM